MAKSLRSKWKRKMRAVKRVRYGVKELAKLKAVVANSSLFQQQELQQQEEVSTVVTFPHKPKRESRRQDEETKVESGAVEKMDKDSKRKRGGNLKNNNGNYPAWLHPRKIRRIKSARKVRAKRNKRLN